jgi:hypothetical protein
MARRQERGSEVHADYAAVERAVAAYDPELPADLTENSYGQIYDRPGLEMRQRELIAVAMLTVLQRTQQLGWHIAGVRGLARCAECSGGVARKKQLSVKQGIGARPRPRSSALARRGSRAGGPYHRDRVAGAGR